MLGTWISEVRERAVRMVQEHRGEYAYLWAAIEAIAPKIGCIPQRGAVAAIGYGIGCSIRIAVWTSACADLDSIMKRADEAMYEAKRQGKNQFVFFRDKE